MCNVVRLSYGQPFPPVTNCQIWGSCFGTGVERTIRIAQAVELDANGRDGALDRKGKADCAPDLWILIGEVCD